MPYRIVFITTWFDARFLMYGGSAASAGLFLRSMFAAIARGDVAQTSASFLGGMGAFIIAVTGLVKELDRASRARREHREALARIEAELRAKQSRIEAELRAQQDRLEHERKAELARVNREARARRNQERAALQSALLHIEQLKRQNQELLVAVSSNSTRIDRAEATIAGSGVFPAYKPESTPPPARPEPDAPRPDP